MAVMLFSPSVHADGFGHDKAVLIKALNAIEKNQWNQAEKLIASTRNPLAERLYYWFYYTKNTHGRDIQFARISSFILQNPDWPKQGTLLFQAERAMTEQLGMWDRIEWFHKFPPRTADGLALYMEALDRHNLKAKKRDMFRIWWGETLLGTQTQKDFIRKYRYLMDDESNLARFNLLLKNDYYTNARNLAQIMGRGYRAVAEARIALARKEDGVDALIANIPPELRDDIGLTYERIRWRRKSGDDFGAMKMFHYMQDETPTHFEEALWHERHILIRRLIEKKQHESAYLLAVRHKQTEGLSFAQAEFLCGWLALRFVNKPQDAAAHFERLYRGVSSQVSKARAAYWAGRAYHAMGDKEKTRAWYEEAARYETRFYGQRALDTLKRKPTFQNNIHGDTLSVKAQFYNRDMVQIAILLHEAGMRKETSAFLGALTESLTDHGELTLLAELSVQFNHLHNAIRLSKKAMRNTPLPISYAYPTLLRKMHDLNITVDWGLVHAIIRQESEFNFTAQSHAGALGLMQLMPGTASDMARKLKRKHSKSLLTRSPNHNILLGSAYMREMLDMFDGSAPLAIAAYNAGPGRVRRWLGEIGDPRTNEIEMLDWLESIPIYETRNYVQRVMESWYVYQYMFKDLQP